MARGTILWFDTARGYGFIRPDLGPRDVFLHVSATAEGPEALVPGAPVDFELVQTGDGRLVARRVLILGRANPS
ncbi:MAG: cold shock domain-containing protein [Sphingomonadaceae bacterium]